MNRAIPLAVLLAASLASSMPAVDLPACAVLSFGVGEGVGWSEAAEMSNRLSALLDQARTFRVLPRLAVNRQLVEAGLDATGGSDPQSAGRALGVDRVVTGRLEKRGPTYRLQSSMVEVASGARRALPDVVKATDFGSFASEAATTVVGSLAESFPAAPAVFVPPSTPAAAAPRLARARKESGAIARTDVLTRDPPPVPIVTERGATPRGPRPAEEPECEDGHELFGVPVSGAWAELKFRRMQQREMKESGGVEDDESFKHYRVRSRRYLAQGELEIAGRLGFSVALGMADLALHGSEGQTREFDPAPAFGVGARGVIWRADDPRVDVEAHASYFRSSADGGKVVRAAGHGGFQSWDRLDVDWSEAEFALVATHVRQFMRLRAGIRCAGIRADESGHRGGIDASGKFDAERSVGFLAGLDTELCEPFWVGLQVNFVDETAFGLSLRYHF